ncbi:hypothetical protein AX14_003286, partial [Amanita brunnescens Koide BX004]
VVTLNVPPSTNTRPGVTARNMSEDVRKKMSNAVLQAGLGGQYAWMKATNLNAPIP